MTTSQPGFGGLAGERADDVVGLETGVLEHGDAQGVEQAVDVRDLLDQVGGRFGAVGFVFGELLVAMGVAEALEDGGHVCGSKVLGTACAACC